MIATCCCCLGNVADVEAKRVPGARWTTLLNSSIHDNTSANAACMFHSPLVSKRVSHRRKKNYSLSYRLLLQQTGNFHVQFTHESFNFENSLINATHAVNHLSFG